MTYTPLLMRVVAEYAEAISEINRRHLDDPDAPYLAFVPVVMHREVVGFLNDEVGDGEMEFIPARSFFSAARLHGRLFGEAES